MSDIELLLRACDSATAYSSLGNERFEADGATFLRNRDAPHRYDANHVTLAHTEAPAAIEALLQRVEREYDGIGHRAFVADPFTPPQLVARLVIEGYKAFGSGGIFLLLEGDLSATLVGHDLREVLSDVDWRAYAELAEENSREDAQRYSRDYDAALFAEWLFCKRAKAGPERSWLAYVDGVACGFFSSWPGDNGVGQVEDLFVRRDYRHRGVATSLIARCVADARSRGAESLLIAADPDDTPKQMYAALGFRPLFVSRFYVRILQPAG